MAIAEPRIETIANALALAAQAQGVIRVADLDFEQMAAAVEAINGTTTGIVTSPLDPEGDGLTTKELNAANDG
jgi:uncharacterized protein YbjT (DUF2867 family)